MATKKAATPKLMDKRTYDKLQDDIENAESDLGLLEEMIDALSWQSYWPKATIESIKKLRRDLKKQQTVAAKAFERLENLLEREDERRDAAHATFCERCGQQVPKKAR